MRTLTAKGLFLEEQRESIARERELRLANPVDGQDNRGVHQIVKKKLWDDLDEEQKRDYEERARQSNERSEAQRVDEDVIKQWVMRIQFFSHAQEFHRNQDGLKQTLATVLGSLSGHTKLYQIGDAVFHLEYAYVRDGVPHSGQ